MKKLLFTLAFLLILPVASALLEVSPSSFSESVSVGDSKLVSFTVRNTYNFSVYDVNFSGAPSYIEFKAIYL